VDDRRAISGIVHVLKSGCRWCDSVADAMHNPKFNLAPSKDTDQ